MATLPIASAVVSAESLRDRARDMVEDLKQLASGNEKNRRLLPEAFAMVRDAGFLGILQPKSCGGHELSMRDFFDIVSIVGEGCMATAWVLDVANAHAWMMAHFSEKAQRDVYGADPNVLVSGVIGPRGKAVAQADGSYVLEGFWPFASGSEHASWVLLGASVTESDGSYRTDADFLVPASDLTYHDDWHVSGLQGTGSCSISVKNLTVPSHRMLDFSALLAGATPIYSQPGGGLYKAQSVPVLTLALCAAPLGAARTALEAFRRAVPGKKVLYTPHIADQWIVTQTALGQAASMIHAAELLLYRAADDTDEWAARGEEMPLDMRGRIRSDAAYATRLLADALNILLTNGGASGLSTKSPLQRIARDMQAANMHGLLLLEAGTEIYGRIQLGLGPNSPVH